MDSSTKQRAQAQSATAFGNLRDKTDLATKRMAGAALLAAFGPSILTMVDGEENTMVGDILGGGASVAGIGLGGYLGYRDSTIPAEQLDQYKRSQMSEFKKEVKELMKTNPEKARDKLAALKNTMLNDLEPIDPKRAPALNHMFRSLGEIGEPIADMDLANKTPRQLRGMSKGALIGAAASAIPAYLLFG